MKTKYPLFLAISALVFSAPMIGVAQTTQPQEATPSASVVCKNKLGFEQRDNLSTEERSLFKKCLRENAPAQEFGDEPEEETRQKRLKNNAKPTPKTETEHNEQMMGEHQH